jgi:hypothetical protein
MLRGDVKRSEHTSVEKFVSYIISLDEPIPPPKKSQSTALPNAEKGVNTTGTGSNSSGKAADQTCSNCKKGNHALDTCRQEGGAQERHCDHCGKFGHVSEKCWKKHNESRSNVSKSITQSAQLVNTNAPEVAEIDSKAIMDELKQLREDVKRQNTQYGNSPFAETTRALMAPHLPAQSNLTQCQRGITFVCDSGATTHMVNDASLFTSFVGCDVEVRTANKESSLRATAIGTVHVQVAGDLTGTPISLRRALYVPGLSANLLSVRRLHMDGHVLTFSPNSVSLSRDDKTVATGQVVDDLYVFLMCRPFEELACISINSKPPPKTSTWEYLHRAAGHVNLKTIKDAFRKGRVRNMEVAKDVPKQCLPCALSKMPTGKFGTRDTEYKAVGDLIYSDLMFFDRPSVTGFTLAAVFLDAHSNFAWAYPL